jgi:hypothetical protein
MSLMVLIGCIIDGTNEYDFALVRICNLLKFVCQATLVKTHMLGEVTIHQ